MVRQQDKQDSNDFGKDLGLMKELVVTGRQPNVRAGKEFYSALAHNAELFGKTVLFVKSGGNIVSGYPADAYVFPTWKTIKLGTFKHLEALYEELEKVGVGVRPHVRKMMELETASYGNKTGWAASTEELVRVTNVELGFPSPAWRSHIYSAAVQHGPDLCKHYVGLELRLQYMDQPIGEKVLIGMDPIPDLFNSLSILELTHYESCRSIEEAPGSMEHLFGPDTIWVFRRRKSA
jgi:hypothetical protein